MRYYLPACLLSGALSLGLTARAQNSYNLVNNGDFELQNVSPLSGRYRNVKSTSVVNNADELTGWYSSNSSDPQYFATNSPTQYYSNPLSQSAVSGPYTPYNYNSSSSAHNGGIGILTYSRPCCPDGIYEEYIMGTLTTPLQNGVAYYGSMQVRSAPNNSNVTQYANVGFDITPTDVSNNSNPNHDFNSSTTSYVPVFNATGVGVQSSAPVANTDWTRISHIFTGNAGGKFINIGNFQPYTYSGTANIPPPNGNTTFAYVLIDHVEVYKIPTAGPPVSIVCGRPTTIGEALDIPGASYAWTIGNGPVFATTPQTQVSPTANTTYTLTVTLPDNSTYASKVDVTIGNYGVVITGSYRRNGGNVSGSISNQGSYNVTSGQYVINLALNTKQSYSPITATFSPWTFGDSGAQGAYNSNNNTQGTVTLQQLYAGVTISATATSACNESASIYFRLYASSNGRTYAVTNPSVNTMTISLLKEDGLDLPDKHKGGMQLSTTPVKATEEAFTAYLYNTQGALVKQLTLPAGQTAGTLAVQDLPEGPYILRTSLDKGASGQHIQVVH